MTVVPDYIEPMVMWRAWLVSADGLLYSPNRPCSWPAGEALRASCPYATRHEPVEFETMEEALESVHAAERAAAVTPHWWAGIPPVPTSGGRYVGWSPVRGHDPPGKDCKCGIYAVNHPMLVPGYRCPPGDPTTFGMIAVAVGTVKLWGRVVPGEMGARAEFAYPGEIVMVKPDLLLEREIDPDVLLGRIGENYGIRASDRSKEIRASALVIQNGTAVRSRRAYAFWRWFPLILSAALLANLTVQLVNRFWR